MGRHSKKKRFAQNRKRHNVIERGKPLYTSIKGKWRDVYFQNNHPIVLEVGCGRGEYTVGLAKQHPNVNYIGMDIKGDRIWYGSGWAIDASLQNVAFLRTRAEFLTEFFTQEEVDEIWITFPGPRPKKGQAKKRLTSDRFLDIYKEILAPNGVLHLKTDSDLMYRYTKEQIASRSDLQLLEDVEDIYKENHSTTNIQTYYEEKFRKQGKTIKYLRFRFKHPLTKPAILSIITSLFKKR